LIYFSANTLILENKINLKDTKRLINSSDNGFNSHSDGSGLKDNETKYYMNEIHCDKSKTNTFSCDICGHEFTRKTYLSSHKLRMHSNGNGIEFKCDFPQCQYKTHLTQSLKSHKRNVHFRDKTLKVECETCGRICSSNSVLNRHKKVFHSSDKLKCHFENCHFETRHLKNLKEH